MGIFPHETNESVFYEKVSVNYAATRNESRCLRAIDFINWRETGLGDIQFPSTTNRECIFDLKKAMRTALR